MAVMVSWSFMRNLLSLVLVMAALPAMSQPVIPSTPFFGQGVPNGVWISPANSSGFLNTGAVYGLGTFSKPFYGDFDVIINSLPAYTVIRLLPGTFISRGYCGNAGDPVYKEGQQIMGSGMDVTVIKRDPGFYFNQPVYGLIHSTGDNLKASDLTVDASGTSSYLTKVEGIESHGNNGLFNRIKVTGTCGNQAENFSVFIGDPGPLPYAVSTNFGNIVQNCIVTNVLGAYGDGIAAHGSYLLFNNKIYMPVVTNFIFNYSMFGLNASATLNGRMINNYVYGGSDAVHNDTGSHTNLLVAFNTFVNCFSGINFQPTPNQGFGLSGLKIVGNQFELSTNYWSSYRVGIGLWNYETTYQPWDGILIEGNAIHFVGDVRPSSIDGNQYSIAVFDPSISTNFTGVQILRNTVDGGLNGTFPTTGVWLANNTDLAGWPIYSPGFANRTDPLNSPAVAQTGQSVNLAMPQSPLDGGLIFDALLGEGSGANAHNLASSHENRNAGHTPAGSVLGKSVWVPNAAGAGLVTTNSTTTPDDLSTLTNHRTLAMPTNFSGSSNFSVEIAYTQPSFSSNNPVMFFGQIPGGSGAWLYCRWGAGSSINIGVTTTVTNFDTSATANPPADGNFHDVTITYNGTNLTGYFDGTSIGNWACSGAVPSLVSAYPAVLWLGAMEGGVSGQTRIWNRCLTANEVLRLYRHKLVTDYLTGSQRQK
jgi:hypothetical protein